MKVVTHVSGSPADARLFHRAGIAAIAGAVVLVLTAFLLVVGATGLTSAFGWANDVAVVAAFALLGPGIIATSRLGRATVRRWFDAVSWLALAGILVLAAGQLLLVGGVIRIGPAFVAVGFGMSAVLAWGIGYATLAWQGHAELASRSVAAWVLASAASFVASSLAWPILGVVAWSVVGVALLISWVGWWITLGRDLIRRAAAGRPVRSRA
jgi:hypothetical protein